MADGDKITIVRVMTGEITIMQPNKKNKNPSEVLSGEDSKQLYEFFEPIPEMPAALPRALSWDEIPKVRLKREDDWSPQ